MVGLMGLLDLHAAILLCALGLGAEIPLSLVVITAILLFAKACLDLTDVGAWQDIAAALLILAGIFFILPQWFLFVVAVLMGFKGLSSLVA